MMLSLNAFEVVVGTEIAPLYAMRVRTAYEAITGSEACDDAAISLEDAGRILLFALAPDTVARLDDVQGPPLSAVGISSATRQVCLTPDEARSHPLAGEWISDDAAAAITRLLSDAGDLSTAAPSSPRSWDWNFTEVDGELSVVVRQAFAFADGIELFCLFGPDPEAAGFMRVTRVIPGEVLAAVGVHMRDLAAPAAPGSIAENNQILIASIEADGRVVH